MDGMAGRVALVTGAAGGIGAEVVAALGERGVSVAAVDRSAERLSTMATMLAEKGMVISAHPADVADPGQVETAVTTVENELGPIDYLVNCAGILRVSGVAEMSEMDWLDTLEVNCTGVFLVSRAVVRRMIPRGTGAVVTVGSNAAGTARTGMGAYAASKAAATALTTCLGLEVAKHGIRCNVVAPGSTDTPMLTALWTGDDARRVSIEGAPAAFRVGIPLGRLARPADVANAVLFLLSDHASHVTMHALTVDGGAALGH